MKKVREEDLKYLIAVYYRMFLDPEHKPINDILDGHGDIKININSVYIEVFNVKNYFKDELAIGNFSRKIEAITFGNLKVTYWNNSCIYIANSYKIIYLNEKLYN